MKNLAKILFVTIVFGIQSCSAPILNYNNQFLRLEKELKIEINKVREKKKLKALNQNYILDNLAHEHSKEMVKEEKASHNGFEQRFWVVSNIIEKRIYNENVAYVWSPIKNQIELTMDVWLKSKEHSANIFGDYDLTGIGIEKDDFGGYYITQIFVKD